MKISIIPLIFSLLVFSPVMHAAQQSSKPAISKQQAASIAQQSHPGRVLAVKYSNGIYRVKILSSKGEVRTIRVDANTGNTLN